MAHLLAEELKAPEPEVRVVPHECRGRYSFRQEQRTPDTPNLACIRVGYRLPASAWGLYLGSNPQEEAAMKGLLSPGGDCVTRDLQCIGPGLRVKI
ncbi:MAG TPA: hypothetical protein EYP49_16745 [Anaerolineae bacterium]|nr:hypothetical protein [Anaerolineae bacterium]